MANWWDGLIDTIDAGLKKHYEDLNKPYKANQFKNWADEENGFDDEDVKNELNELPKDNALIDFDQDFPLIKPAENEEERKIAVIQIFNQIARPDVMLKRLHKDICSGMEHKWIELAVERYMKQMSVLSAQAKQDEDLKYYLGVNQREGFPFLMFMVDSFTRDKASYFHKSKGAKSLSIAEWAQRNKFLGALKKYHPQRFNSLQAAMKSYNARIMNRLQFNTTYLIVDNLRQVAEYIVATPLFIQKLVEQLKADQSAAPFQVNNYMNAYNCNY